MKTPRAKEILGNGCSLTSWSMALQAKLGRKNVLGHVFHDIPGIRPITAPVDPTITNPAAENYQDLLDLYLTNLERWTLGEIEAKNIIIQRLTNTMRPNNYNNMTAKALFDTIAGTRTETATAPYAVALENLLYVRFVSTADEYTDRFLAVYQSVNNAADAMNTLQAAQLHRGYHVGAGQASAIFVRGTKRIEWVTIWRDTRAYTASNEYAPLQTLMSSLRSVAGNRVQHNPT